LKSIRGDAVIRIFLAGVISASAIVLGLMAAARAADVTQGEAAAHAPLRAKQRLVRRAPPYRNSECCGEVYRYVYAEAWYGNQKIIAPVRRGECCDQVQIPGGAWINCVFSCEITLRKMRLDYWQDHGAGYNKELSPGYPRSDFYTNAWGYRSGYMF
jgi:hypothetical protein